MEPSRQLGLVRYTKAAKAVAANAELGDAATVSPSRWLIAVAGDIEHVDTAGQVGAARWPASDKVLSFSAAAGVRLGLTAISPEDDSTGLEKLRQSVMSIGVLGMPTVEGSHEFATIRELLRAATYLRQSETFVPVTMQQRAHVTPRRATPNVALRRRFSKLATQWRSETAVESSVSRRTMHWAYQQIIGLGPDALPLILEELERETDDWFWALAAITGEDPAEGMETLDSAAEAWLEWGRSKGHLGDRAA